MRPSNYKKPIKILIECRLINCKLVEFWKNIVWRELHWFFEESEHSGQLFGVFVEKSYCSPAYIKIDWLKLTS